MKKIPGMNSLLNWSHQFPLKRKITFFVALLLFLAIFTVGFSSYSIAVKAVVHQVFESQHGLVGQITNNLDQLLNDAEDISSLIIIDPGLQQALKSPAVPTRFIYPDTVVAYLDKIMAVKSFISMITIYGYNGLTYSVGTDFIGSKVVPFAEFKQNPLFRKALALNGSIGMEYFRNVPRLTYDNRLPRIVLYRVVKEWNDYQNTGILLIWLNERNIRANYQNNVPTGGSIYIVNENGMIVSSSEPQRLNQPLFTGSTAKNLLTKPSVSQTIRYNGKTMLLTLRTSQVNSWKVIALTPAAIVTEKIKSIALIILMVCIICYILLLVFSNLITTMITNPLQQLLASINKVQSGDFSQQVRFVGADEIGELGRGYNMMVLRIRDLIERVYKLQIKEREAELKALQAQINPHFLYNTLDTIYWKANRCQALEIGEMVYALSRIFRLSLNRGLDLTTVALEEELIRNYLALQQMRLKQKLEYRIDFDAQMLPLEIPKLILQPFVENAIIHGIEVRENGGRVSVTGRTEADLLIFTIGDNGVGMTAEKISRVLTKTGTASLDSNPTSGGYAIQNVLERLELYYGTRYTLHFDSQPKTGTTVTLKIPRQVYKMN